MQTEIVVRKNRAQRRGILFIFVLMVCASILEVVLMYPLYQFGLLSLFASCPAAVVWLYYETWHISLSAKGISNKSVFTRAREYSYSQITDARVAYSVTMHYHICLTFSDGHSIRFQAEDENAVMAKRRIQSHCSIRTNS